MNSNATTFKSLLYEVQHILVDAGFIGRGGTRRLYNYLVQFHKVPFSYQSLVHALCGARTSYAHVKILNTVILCVLSYVKQDNNKSKGIYNVENTKRFSISHNPPQSKAD